MLRSLKWFSGSVAALVVLLVLAVLLLPRILDTDRYRLQLEERMSLAAGMDVNIGEPLDLAIWPGLQLVLGDVHFTRDGQDIAAATRVDVGVDLLPLLRGQAKINKLVLHGPVLNLARDAEGRFNFARRVPYQGRLDILNLQQLVVIDGAVHFADALTAADYAALACAIDLGDFLITGRLGDVRFGNLTLAGALHCGELSRNNVIAQEFSIAATGGERRFTLAPVTLQLFGAVGSGRFEIDLTGDAPRYDVAFDLDQFRSEAFAGALAPRQTMEGALDLALHATLEGSTSDTLKRSLAGELSLQGRDLTLHGIDLDDEFSRYQATQNFNLVDLGAFFFVGPLGLAVTKGYDFAGIFAGTGSRSEIRALVSEWTITEGLAVAEDVALATPRNRIALKGGLDFPAGEFSDLTMALVDARGCAVIEQVIHGSFQAPQIEQPGILRTLAGPAIALLEQGLDLLPGEIDCEPFYTGSLAAPQ